MAKTRIYNGIYKKQLAYKNSLKPQSLWNIHPQTSQIISSLSTRLYRLRISIQRETNVEVGKISTKSSEKNTSRLQQPYNLLSISQRSEKSYLGEKSSYFWRLEE